MHSGPLFDFGGTSRYVVEREIGQGGTGTVYQALDKERGIRVALKALKKTDAINIYRLKKEFRQLADISHPNLVTLHELTCDGGQWFFTMDLVEGKTFDRFVNTQERINPMAGRASRTSYASGIQEVSASQNLNIKCDEQTRLPLRVDLTRTRHALAQLAHAIAALHDAGKLHRDIKPSNILVTPDSRVVVLDFGLVSDGVLVEAESRAVQTVGGHAFGTPAYMSPEQAAGEAVTTASDWYSLGAVLYESLTGQLPFDGTVLEILRRKDEEEPPPPSALVSGVPDDLDQLCQALLRRLPHERPSGADILRHLRHPDAPVAALSTHAPASNHVHAEVFVGRQEHLQALERACAAVERNQPVVALLHGPSGMGKTALAKRFANDLVAKGKAVVLQGRCFERESVPYKAFDNVIDALSRYMMQVPLEQAAELLPRNVHSLARLFPVLRRVRAIAQARTPQHAATDARELRSQAFAALKDLLLRISDFQPLVIQIDDLQWGDSDSARLLLHLLDPPEAPSILFVGAYRDDEVENSPFLRHVLGDKGLDANRMHVVELDVQPLSPREAENLTKELLHDYPAVNTLFASAIATESDGVPYFIGELVQHLRSQPNDSPIAIGSISLEDVIAERISQMSESAQRLLQTLSVAAGPLEQGIAMQAAGIPITDRSSLLALRAARLVRTRGTRQTDYVETYHDRVRETVVSRMHPEVVRDCHARIAEAIETWGLGDAERLVQHYSEAGDGVRAGETAIQAARAASKQLAFNRAAQLYERAIAIFQNDNAILKDLYAGLGEALANAGRSGAAGDAYKQAAELEAGPTRQALLRLAAQQYLRSGRTEQGSALVEEILRHDGLSLPTSNAAVLASLLVAKARTALLGLPSSLRQASDVPHALSSKLDTIGTICQEVAASSPIRGALLRAWFHEYAVRSREPQRLIQALVWRAVHLSVLGGPRRLARADAVLSRVREIIGQYPSNDANTLLYLAQSCREMFSGQFADGIYWARRSEELLRAQSAARFSERRLVTLVRHIGMEFVGDLRSLASEAHELVRDASERDDRVVQGPLAISSTYTHLMADKPEEALTYLTQLSAQLPSNGATTLDHLIALRTVDADLYLQRGVAAWDCIRQATSGLTAAFLQYSRFVHVYWSFYVARAGLAAHVETSDHAALAEAQKRIGVLQKFNVGFRGYADALQATISQRQGRLEHAIVLMKRATEGFSGRDDRRMLYAKHRLGKLMGGDKGRDLTSASAELLQGQGIQNPDRWVAMMLGDLLSDS